MAHRRGAFRGSRGISDAQRRKKTWGPFTANLSPLGVPSTTIVLGTASTPGVSSPEEAVSFLPFTEGIFPESTILRIRGSLNMDKNSVASPRIVTNAFGIGVMETGALLLGSAPNPASPQGSNWDGWMFHRSINNAVVDAASTWVDVKSMRKIQSGYSLFFCLGIYVMTDDDSAPTTASTTCEFTARGLFLLP